jgi:pimeloyl-ACP methyl ester carboxylesterase
MSERVTSVDGTTIAFDRSGTGPAVILVHGAFTDKTHPTLSVVAAALARWFTVFNYDRRGRGQSGDTSPYAVAREIEDLASIIKIAGGSAMLFGGSSGGALALEAASQDQAISKLVVWEPPYHVDDSAPELPRDLALQLTDLVEQGRGGDAAELFFGAVAEVPAEAIAAMRGQASWKDIEAIAHTLAYEAMVMGPGNALPAGRLATITQPTLVLNGESSPTWMKNAGMAVTQAIPRAARRVLENQTHNVDPEPLVEELMEFLITA